MYIKNITIKNFKSIGNKKFTFKFNESDFNLVKGRSGNGKTLLLSAIYFVLYGKSSDMKGSSKSTLSVNQLINDINKSDCVVTATLSTGYVITRGLKPNIFTIQDKDGNNLADKSAKKIDQEFLIQDILYGITSDVFMSTVYLSNKTISAPFLYMTNTERKNYIEQILDLRVIYHLNENLKPYISNNKLEIVTKTKEKELINQSIENEKYNLDKLKSNIESQKDKLKTFKKDNEESIFVLNKEIGTKDKELSDIVFKEDMIKGDIKSLEDKIVNIDEMEYSLYLSNKKETEDKLNTLKNMMINKKGEKDNHLKAQENYHMCKGCPTLPKIIGVYDLEEYDKFLEKSKEGYSKLSNTILKLTESIQKLNEIKNTNSTIQRDINALKEEHRDILYKINNAHDYIKSKQDMITRIENEQEPVIQEYNEDYYIKLKEDYNRVDKELDEQINKTSELDILKKVINDKEIKAKAMESYLPIFESKLNELLSRFYENMSFSLKAKLTNDFELTFYKNNKELSIYSLSTGQLSLINLAVTFSFLHLLKIKHKNSFNMLFIDEILDSSMSTSVIYPVQYLRELSKDSSITVISHDATIHEEFYNVYDVEIKNGFTEYTKL